MTVQGLELRGGGWRKRLLAGTDENKGRRSEEGEEERLRLFFLYNMNGKVLGLEKDLPILKLQNRIFHFFLP